jgi:hypothetical protein
MGTDNDGDKKPVAKKKNKILPGIILIILGAIFLLNNYGFTNFDIGKLWPLFLIVPGVFMIIGKSQED